MALTREQETLIFELLGMNVLPRPKVVTRDDLGTIRDADVHVSRADPNTASGQDKVVEVRRPDYAPSTSPSGSASKKRSGRNDSGGTILIPTN
jgi:hypothetical protein